jgi:hypothetical protein
VEALIGVVGPARPLRRQAFSSSLAQDRSSDAPDVTVVDHESMPVALGA